MALTTIIDTTSSPAFNQITGVDNHNDLLTLIWRPGGRIVLITESNGAYVTADDLRQLAADIEQVDAARATVSTISATTAEGMHNGSQDHHR